jgi:hypothetical protein
MRTTIRLDENLLARAKAHAASTRRSLNELIEESLRAQLSAEQKKRAPAGSLPTFKGRGPLPGVDINDSANLIERMEHSD